jgi:membrane protein
VRKGPRFGARVAWTLLRRTVRDADRDRVLGLSAEVAFFGLFALPPTILTMLGAMGWLGELFGSDLAMRAGEQIIVAARIALSHAAVRDVVAPTVERLLEEGRLDVVSIGALIAVWSASRAAYALLDALRIAYDIHGKVALWKRNARAVVLTLGGVLFAGIGLPLLTAGPRFGAQLASTVGMEETFERLWALAFWPGLVAGGILGLTGLYNYAIPWKTPFWRDLPGAALAMALWLVSGVGLRAYASWVVEASPVYGSLAAPMVILLWLYLTTLAVLMGGELNAEVERMWPTITRAEREKVRLAAERDVEDDELEASTLSPSDVDSSSPSNEPPLPAVPPEPIVVAPVVEPVRRADVESTLKSRDHGAGKA